MKRFVEGLDRGQSTLFPETLEDFVAEDNAVRVIEAFVEALDLGGLGFSRVGDLSARPAVLSSLGPAEALHLRLSQPGSVEPAT
jgi:transposase